MAADAVPVPSRTGFSEAQWFRLVVRTILALFALWVLHFAEHRFSVFWVTSQTRIRTDVWLWLSSVGCSAAAGLLFGLAAWLPFTRVRYLWSRLLLAALAFAPVAHFWLVFIHLHKMSGWLAMEWFWGLGAQFALAVLVGVAIASGFRAKGSGAAGLAG